MMVWCRELHQRSVLMVTTCAVTSLHFVLKPLVQNRAMQCGAHDGRPIIRSLCS